MSRSGSAAPPKTFLISTDIKVRDQLEGTISLQRGFICQEQDLDKKGDSPWVKVLTYICIHRFTQDLTHGGTCCVVLGGESERCYHLSASTLLIQAVFISLT